MVYHTGYVASRLRIALSNSRLQRARTVRNDNRYSACVFVCCNSGVERIEAAQRAEASAELIADAVALVAKWNADIERRKDSQYGYADRARLPQFSPHIGAAILAKKSWLRLSARPASSRARSICAKWCGLPTIPSTGCTTRSHAHSAPAVATVRAR